MPCHLAHQAWPRLSAQTPCIFQVRRGQPVESTGSTCFLELLRVHAGPICLVCIFILRIALPLPVWCVLFTRSIVTAPTYTSCVVASRRTDIHSPRGVVSSFPLPRTAKTRQRDAGG
jgi:hypothetical protein